MRSVLCALVLLGAITCATSKEPRPAPEEESTTVDVAAEATAFVAQQEELLRPLELASNLAWFDASVAGSDEAWAKSQAAEDALNRFYSDPARFERVKELRAVEGLSDPALRRQIEVLYLRMLGKQVPPELLARISALDAQVQKTFNTYRGKVGGKETTQNEIEEILHTSKSTKKLKEAWEAQKAVGPLVVPALNELVSLRNQVAKQLGFRDFYALRIAESEQDEEKLLALFDQLDELTREPFLAAKAEVDKRLARRLKIKPDQLRPWHYQNPFFQDPPDVYRTGLDAVYQKQDTLELCRRFYSGIGMEVDDILKRSDLYEKEGKTPHAFCADIDRSGDIRVLANIVPGQRWQSTMLHELGHAVYDKYIDAELPWLLRKASHPLTTEGVAMMLDRLVGNPRWAEAMGIIDEGKRDKTMEEANAYLAFASLQFSRWTQVMLRFERELYRDPEQDLGKLWWDLVEKYQGLTRPKDRTAPDYAAKIHVVIVPVYYHNYMMGELFAAQVHEAIAASVGTPPAESVYNGDPRVGQFLIEKLFKTGALHRWDALTEMATGKELSAEAFARRFAI